MISRRRFLGSLAAMALAPHALGAAPRAALPVAVDDEPVRRMLAWVRHIGKVNEDRFGGFAPGTLRYVGSQASRVNDGSWTVAHHFEFRDRWHHGRPGEREAVAYRKTTMVFNQLPWGGETVMQVTGKEPDPSLRSG